jgi:hypothetical protein
MRKGPNVEITTPQASTRAMSLDSLPELPEELRRFPPPDEVQLNLIDIYFRYLGHWSVGFLHEGIFRKRLQEQTIPKHLLYAVCAASAK